MFEYERENFYVLHETQMCATLKMTEKTEKQK